MMSYVKNLSKLVTAILAVSFISCITYQEPTWTYPSVKWNVNRLPLTVSSEGLNEHIPDIKAAIDVWNKAAGCQILSYEELAVPSIFITRGNRSWVPYRGLATSVRFMNYSEDDMVLATIYVHNPHAGDWPHLVFAHALGRTLGLAQDPHHRTSIMYSYADNYRVYSRVREADRKVLRERYCR